MIQIGTLPSATQAMFVPVAGSVGIQRIVATNRMEMAWMDTPCAARPVAPAPTLPQIPHPALPQFHPVKHPQHPPLFVKMTPPGILLSATQARFALAAGSVGTRRTVAPRLMKVAWMDMKCVG